MANNWLKYMQKIWWQKIIFLWIYQSEMPEIKEKIWLKNSYLAYNKKQKMIFGISIFINPIDVIYPIKEKNRWKGSKIEHILLHTTWTSQAARKES